MSEGERIYLPGWVKPSVALALALMGAGATAGWVGANYARSTDTQIQEIRGEIRDTKREVCAIRAALNVTSYTFICGDRQFSAMMRTGAMLPAALVQRGDDLTPQVPEGGLMAIVSALAVGLFILCAGWFLLVWSEIGKLRKLKHDVPNLMGLMRAMLDTMDLVPDVARFTAAFRQQLDEIENRLRGTT